MTNALIIPEDTIKQVQDMTINEVYQLANQAQEFNNFSNMELTLAIKHISNLRNENNNGGFSKGVSNKVVCARETVNHVAVHEALEVLGWIDGKAVTLEGWDATHDHPDTHLVNVSFANHRPVFDIFNGSLYWNESHPNYAKVWEQVLNVETPSYGVVKFTQYNKALKDSEGCMSASTRAMLKASGKRVL